MPELPEVEVVRAGLAPHVVGRTIASVEVAHPRAIRRHLGGIADFAAQLTGRRVDAVRRRGKYLWWELGLDDAADHRDVLALVGHLGMSGQMLVTTDDIVDQTHLRLRVRFAGPDGLQVRFVDQRTFGGFSIAELVPDRADGSDDVPEPIAHIARDPMDPLFDTDTAARSLRRRRTEVKRALLDQGLVSGIGNIYADEALWLARLHGTRPTDRLPRASARAVLQAAHTVMADALRAGGTSFDALYVNVNGESGYFDRSLHVYGREGLPCHRCGSPIRREPFMNRSSYSCPRCQRRPRRR